MDQSLDKVGSLFVDLDDQDYDFYLTEAVDRLIKRRYNPNNLYRKGFEQSQKRTEDLKNLVKTGFIPGTAYIDGSFHDVETVFSDIGMVTAHDNEYMFYLRGEAFTEGCKDWNSIDIVEQDDYTEIKKDPHNTPDLNNPIGLFENGGIVIEPSVTSIKVTFLAKHPPISDTQDCLLSEHVHKEIVQLAVSIVIENIESPRVQTHDSVNVE